MKASVLMPAYNCGPYIGDAIKSILAQTMKEFELIIINDGSTDDTLEVVESFRDSRLRVVNQSNQGLAGVRNRAVKEASADYISWLDSDDLATPDRLEKQVALLESKPDIGICSAYVQTFGEFVAVWKYPVLSEDIKCHFVFEDPIATSSVTMRRTLFSKNSVLFNTDFPPAEDYDVWERLSAYTRIQTIPEFLIKYRVHPSQTSKEKAARQEESVWKIQERQLRNLGLMPDEQDRRIHTIIGARRKIQNLKDFKAAEIWLEKIANLMEESGAYNPEAVKKMSANLWFSLCSHNTHLGLQTWTAFSSSPLSRAKDLPSNTQNSARIFLKSLLRR